MTANFNFVANEASAKYFMWAAHDDEWAPTYVQRCVERLEEDPRYVLCASWVRFVGPREPSTPEIFHNLDIARPGPHALVAALSVPGWYALYGVIRRDALARTSLVKYIWGPDVALLFELAMLGDFAIVPEPLFYYRYRGYDAATELRLASLTSAPGVSDSRPDLYTSLLREIYRTLLSSSGPPWFRLSLAWTFTYHAFITSFNWQLLLQRDASRQLRAAVESRDIWGFVRALLKKLVFTPYAPHIVIPNVIRRVRRSLRRSR